MSNPHSVFSARIEPHEIMHVGDDVAKDYIGALGVGWNAFLIDRDNYNHSGVDVDHVCRDFHDVGRKLGLDVAPVTTSRQS